MTDEERDRLRHDLRQPLVLVSGFAQLLEAEGEIDEATRRDYARRIVAAADDLRDRLDAT